MEVVDSEIAWNGSISGGVTGVNDAMTTTATASSTTTQEPLFYRQALHLRLLDLQPGKSLYVHKEVDFEGNKMIMMKSASRRPTWVRPCLLVPLTSVSFPLGSRCKR